MIRIGVIGYGVRMDMLMDQLHALPYGAKVVAIADINPARVRALMLKNGSPQEMHRHELDKIDGLLRKCPINPDEINFYADADDMLKQETLDGVMVGTNCDTHAFFAEKVLARGLPLFLEKPVATSMEGLQRLAATCNEVTSPTVVSFPLRATALIREAKRLLDGGIIGKIDHVQAYNDVPYGFVYFHDWYRDESVTQGLFLQKATHDIDVLNFLLEERPVDVCAMKSKQLFKGTMPAGLRCADCGQWESCMESTYNIRYIRNDVPRSDFCCYAADTGNEDSGSMLVRYESGMHVAYAQNFFARKKAGRRGARLYGYKGTLEYSFTTNQIIVYDHMSDKVTTVQIPDAPEGHGGGDIELMRNYVQLIMGKAKQSIAPLQAGIESALICLQAKNSAESRCFCSIRL